MATEVLDEDKLSPDAWKVLLVVLLGPFMAQLDSTVVNVSLSNIRDALHSTINTAQWIISGYLLALALMLPINGWLVDRFGAKRLYLGCFSAFTIASVLCGQAHSMDQLILARVVQGMAGGLLAPMTQLMVARVAGRNMHRVIGYTVIPVLLAPLLGPVVAGSILDYASWPWLFYINLPIGVLAVSLSALLLPKDQPSDNRRPFDLLGLLLISPGLVLILYGLEKFSHHESGIAMYLGLALLLAFYWDAKRKGAAALIDLDLFKNKSFSMAVLTQFLSNGLIYAGQFLVPLYLIQGCDLSPTRAGWTLAPMGIGLIVISPLMGPLVDRLGFRGVASMGAILSITGTVPFLWMIRNHYSPALTMVSLLVRGLGQGATGLPSISAAYSVVSKAKIGFANTALNIVQRLGGPFATTALAIIVSYTSSGTSSGTGSNGYFIPFIAMISLQVLVLASAMQLPKRGQTPAS